MPAANCHLCGSEKRMGHKGGQRLLRDESTATVWIGEKAYLGTVDVDQ